MAATISPPASFRHRCGGAARGIHQRVVQPNAQAFAAFLHTGCVGVAAKGGNQLYSMAQAAQVFGNVAAYAAQGNSDPARVAVAGQQLSIGRTGNIHIHAAYDGDRQFFQSNPSRFIMP